MYSNFLFLSNTFFSFFVSLIFACYLLADTNFFRGDSNSDGNVDISDAVFITLFIIDNEAPPCYDSLDVNDDGQIDINDAYGLLNFLFMGGSEPKPPGPWIKGLDPTDDSLSCISNFGNEIHCPNFIFGFECPDKITFSNVGEKKTLDIYATIELRDNTYPIGVQGWSFGIKVQNATIDNITLDGITVDTIYDEDNDNNSSTPPIHHDSYIEDLGGSDVFFNFANLSNDINYPPQTGAISGIILKGFEKMALQPNGIFRIAKLTVTVEIKQNTYIQLQFIDGLKTTNSQPINNTVVFYGYNCMPILNSCSFLIEILPPPPIFKLDFEGYPEKIFGVPGEEKTFDIFSRLTTSDLPSSDGPQGWSISIEIEGGKIEEITLEGVRVHTYYEEDDDFNPATPPIIHEDYIEDLLNPNVLTRVADLATYQDDPNRKGAISSAVLRSNEKMVLHPNCRDQIAKITVSTTILENQDSVILRYVDGYKSVYSQPVKNVITWQSLSISPNSGSITIPIFGSVRVLEFDSSEYFSLNGSNLRYFYKLSAPLGSHATVTITDLDLEDSNGIYLRWGDIPETYRYDLVANVREQANQKLIIPYFRSESAYILVSTTKINGGSSDITLHAKMEDLSLGKISATFTGQGGNGLLSAAITGAGFRADSSFRLVHRASGDVFGTIERTIVSPERAEVVFQITGAPVGMYDLKAKNQGEAILENAFEVLETNKGPILKVSLESPERCRYDRLSRITFRYVNEGDQEMTAPLFKIVAISPETDLRLEEEDEFQGTEIQVLGISSSGTAGKLPPGGRGEIPIVFKSRSEDPARFKVFLFSPNRGDYIGWEDLEAPDEASQSYWEALRPVLSEKFGPSWISYRETLAGLATRLARRGSAAASVRELFRFAVRESLGRPISAVVGRVRNVDTGEPLKGVTVVALLGGKVKASTKTLGEGFYCLDWLQGGKLYNIQVVDHGSGITSVEVPPLGDMLGQDLYVRPMVNGLSQACPNCDDSSLPQKTIPLPESLIGEISERGVEVVKPIDPNEKDGPRGDTGVEDEVFFRIFFENLPTATAWAQKIVVTDNLDSNLDWSTFRLSDIRVGSERFFSLDRRENPLTPDIQDIFGGDKSLVGFGPMGQWLLKVYCNFDPMTGKAEWVFQALDPETIMPPDSFNYPDAGFLPPDDPEDKDHRGEGHVTFSVKTKEVDEDTDISNEATIVFDDMKMKSLTTAPVKFKVLPRSLPPEIPHNPFPPSGTSHPIETDDFLAWSSKADEYDVYLWKEGEDPDPILKASGLKICAYKPTENLEYDKVYSWKVVARTNGVEEMGGTWSFKTVEEPPIQPEQPSNPTPPSGAVDVERRPLLKWDQAPWASYYEVYIWYHGENRPSQATSMPSKNQFQLHLELESEREYDWQVIAVNRNPQGKAEGLVWTFKTTQTQFKRGDANSDGLQDVSDAVFTLSHLFLGGAGPECMKTMDINNDGTVDISDPVFLLSHLFQGGPVPNEPFSSCGFDTTPDNLDCYSYTPCSR